MTFTSLLALTCTALALEYVAVHLSKGALAQLQLPATALPLPTDVSPEMQRIVAAQRNSAWDILWKAGEERRAAADKRAEGTLQTIGAMRGRLHVASKSKTRGEQKVYLITPDVIPTEHRDKLLIDVHGGCYISLPASQEQRRRS